MCMTPWATPKSSEKIKALSRKTEHYRELRFWNIKSHFFKMWLKVICGWYWFFVGYILSFGLVRLRTIRLSALVEAHIERREDVTITDVIIKTPNRKWTGDVNDVMPGRDGLRILGDFWKKAVSWDSDLGEASWFLSLGKARPVGSTRCAARGLVRWNIQHSRNCVSLSPRTEKPKSEEGNKSFVPELPRVISV